MTELKHLRVLIAVVETGSFTAAAAERNIEVSAVSRAIRDLEQAVGVTLFDRLPRGVALTQAGRSYVASARDVLERYDRASVDARLAAAGRVMTLGIGFVWSATSLPLLELIRSFSLDFPNTAVAIVEAGNDDIVARVRVGRLDVAIAATDPPPLPRLKPLVELWNVPLWLEPLVTVVSSDSQLGGATWDDLADATLLCRTIDDWPRFVRHVERVGGPALRFEPQSVSQEGVLGLVAAGLGWTLIPSSLAHMLPAGVKAIPILSPGATLQVEALWRPGNPNPALERFLTLCRRIYATSSGGAPS